MCSRRREEAGVVGTTSTSSQYAFHPSLSSFLEERAAERRPFTTQPNQIPVRKDKRMVKRIGRDDFHVVPISPLRNFEFWDDVEVVPTYWISRSSSAGRGHGLGTPTGRPGQRALCAADSRGRKSACPRIRRGCGCDDERIYAAMTTAAPHDDG